MKTPISVLIVEDSAAAAAMLVLELRRGHFEVTSARVDTAAAMKAALEQQTWDLIVCDYTVPNFGAMEALSVLRETGLDLPLIVISGTVSEEKAFDAMTAGARDFLLKGQLARFLPAVDREVREAASRRKMRMVEHERQATLERYRNLVEGTPDGIWLVDGHLRTLHMNGRMAELLAVQPSPDVSIAEFISDGDESGHGHDLRARLEDGPQPSHFNVRRRDGSTLWASVTVSRTTSESGDDTGLMLMVRDITDFKHMREPLRQAQKMGAVGQLAGGVAHDFNNQLTVILGNAEIVGGELGGDHALRQEMLEIQTAGQQAADLTRQLLSFSRKQILQPVILDVNAVVARTLQLIRRVIGERIECVTALGDDLGLVEADTAQMEQVLMNLAVNARDAMPDGGRLTVTTANVELDEPFVRAHLGARLGPHVMVEVRDTGTGMDEETLRHIFEPFFTTMEAGKGTGLGLATVYGVVKQSDGYVAVASTPGAGTAFQVYLPRTTRDIAVNKPAATAPGSARETGTLLVVDDDARIRGMLEKALTRSGYTEIVDSDEKDALARFQRYAGPVDLLVTDVVMPGASGVELYRSLALTRPDLRVLYVSGYARDGVERHGIIEPGAAFLQKPFTAAALVGKVREALNARRGAIEPVRA